MLHIILLILKIFGITLLAIVGLLLLVILTVLLVPIRYRVNVSHGEDFLLESRVTWLLHLIGARITHLEGVLHIRIRILWFTLYDNLKPKRPKVKKPKHRASVKKRNKKNIKSKSIRKGKNRSTDLSESDSVTRKEARSEVEERVKDNTQEFENINTIESSINDKLYEDKSSSFHEDKKISLFQKIINKIISIKDKIVAFFIGIKQKIITCFESIKDWKHKLDLILAFIKAEINKEGFQITYASLKKLLKHILPTKVRSKIIFGTGDPCSTGQALGVLGFLYSIYGDKVVIIPDFENARLEGVHFASGRIRLVTILIIVIKLILDKRFKQLRSNFQILKEAL